MAETAKERIVRYLQDAHAATTGVDQALQGYIDDTNDANIRSVMMGLRSQHQAEAQAIEARLSSFGESPSSGKGFLNMVMAKFSEIMHGAHDEYDKNTQNLIKAHALFHLEHAMYQSLCSYATAIGDQETAQLGARLRDQNKQSAEAVFPLIDAYAKTALAGTVTSGAYPA